MIEVDCKQGTPEWIAARIGLPTASSFDKIITPSGNPTTQGDRYLARLAAEWMLGRSLDDFKSEFMDRGTELEPEAVADYEFQNDVKTREVGLCLRDDRLSGCSPDRLVGDDGLLEVKCPGPEVHMMYVIGGPPKDYFVQVQGQLWVTGRAWCDLLCWHPTLPRVVKRYERDEKFIEAMAAAVGKFTARLAAVREKFADAKAEIDARELDDIPASLTP